MPEIEEWKLGDSGVKNVRYEGMDIHIELMQDKEVNIVIPKSIFADNDIGIIKDETLKSNKKRVDSKI